MKNNGSITKKKAFKRGLMPKLRFFEFQDTPEWKEIQLHKIAKLISEKANNTCIHTVLTLSAEHGIVHQGNYFGKKIAGDNIERYIKIILNDFVYNDRTTKLFTYGTIKRLSRYENGVVSPIYKCFRFNKDENPVFWQWYFESGTHDPQLRGLINEGARAGRFNISIESFLSTLARCPKSKEQKKIADCLSSTDELIVTQTQKLEALKNHKKGLMQVLFPAEGETLPKLRFPEFQDAGEWEIRSLGELLLEHPDYGVNASAVTYSKNLPTYLRITDLPDEGYKLGDEKVSVLVEVTNDKYLNDGDIVLARTGATVGKSYQYKKEDGQLVFAGYLIRIKPDSQKINSMFLFNFISTIQYWKWIGITSARSGQPGINSNEYAALRVPIPPNKKNHDILFEQQKIADCLSSIDELIATQTQKLIILKEHKKGLMQQLFSTNEAQG